MTAELTTVVGQLSINGGHWRKETPNQVAVREPKSADAPGTGKGDLFIVTEIQGDLENRDALEERLAHVIRDTYYLARGSITASLRRALQAGNDLLYHRNRKVSVEERIIGGAVVLVVCQEDAFIAQIGPAAFFAVLGDHIRRYPARSIWLDKGAEPAQDEDVSVLGLSKIVEPSLHHVRVDLEDMLVLTDSRLAEQLPLKDLVEAVQGGDARTAVKNLGKVARARNCSALVLEVIEAAAGPIRLATPAKLSNLLGRQNGSSTDKELVETPASGATERLIEPEVAAEPSQAAARPTPVFANTSIMQKPLQWLGGITGHGSAAEPVKRAPLSATHSPESEHYETRADVSHQAEMISRVVDIEALSDEELPRHFGPTHQTTSSGGRSGRGLKAVLFLFIALLGKSFKALFSIIPGTGATEVRQAGRQAQEPASNGSWVLLRNIAIAIPLLAAVIVGVSYLQKGRLREAEYDEFMTTARNKFEQSQAVDQTSALALMSEAEAALIQAEQIKENQPEIVEMRQQMAEQVDQVTNVQRLYYLSQARQYTDAGTNTTNLVIQGVEVYVLDSGNDRIFHHRLDDIGDALLPDDDTVLITTRAQQIEDIQVGDLLGMTWMPTGGNRQTSDLVILNSTGLLEYNPSWGITTSALAGGESLGAPAAVASYFGNFYILDPQINALLRYLPTVDGYSNPPQSYFLVDNPVDLTNAVDMAIDGAVYILHRDGRIDKFLSGQQVDLNVTGLDKPFNNPVAIYTAPDESIHHLYVADAGNQRIVQLNKDGSFVRQFKPRPGEAVTFANLQDVFVDEIGGRIFILDSNNFYIGKMTTE